MYWRSGLDPMARGMGVVAGSAMRALIAASCVAGVVALSGCGLLADHFTSSAIAVRKDGAALLVAICDPASVTAIKMDERGPGEAKWTPFWDMQLPIPLEFDAGAVLNTAEPPSDAAPGSVRTPSLVAGGELYIWYFDEDVSDSRWAGFRIPSTGVPEDSWLLPDELGTADEACTSERANT